MITTRLNMLAASHAWDAETQVNILMTFIEDHAASKFGEFLDIMEDELGKPADPPKAKRPPLGPQKEYSQMMPVEQPEDPMAAMSVFFDKAMRSHLLTRTLAVPGESLEVAADKEVVQLHMPDDGSMRLDIASTDETAGEVLGGVNYTFEDGGVAVVAAMYASPEDGGPYYDALLALPLEQFPETLPISLPARRTLEDDFEFQYPDGTCKVIRFKQLPF